MSTLSVENFGPIKKADVEIKKVTVFIGNQGAGKSTLAKLISTFSWIEKDLFRRDENNDAKVEKELEKKYKKLFEYHRIDNFLQKSSCIYYGGDVLQTTFFDFEYEKKGYVFNIDYLMPANEHYSLPKITYFPAERNYVSSFRSFKVNRGFNLWSKSLQEFNEIFQEAKDNLKDELKLPINNIKIEYNKLNDILYVRGDNYKIPLADSASGFQSFVPMFVVANYLSKKLQTEYEMNNEERIKFKNESLQILSNSSFTDEQKRMLLSNLAARINAKRTLNIIEEPEQNLFPDSQRKMLNSLLEFNNSVAENQLILTTHSPYIINYLMLAIKAAELKEKANGNAEIENRINEIVPLKSLIPLKDVVIYEVNNDGTISELPQSYGLPSNENFLNNELGEANSLFSELMEIEDLCEQ